MPRSCSSRCYNSRSGKARCRCVCGGANHGSGAKMSAAGGAGGSGIGGRGSRAGGRRSGGTGVGGKGGERIRASVGGTSYTKAPAHSLIGFNAAYFTSAEFQQFQADIRAWAAALGIEVVSFQRAMGVWQNDPASPVELEPSASVEVIGSEADIVALAKQIGSNYKQHAMLIVAPDPNARQFLYNITDIGQGEVGRAIAAMEILEVNGGRYVDGRMEIADSEGRWRERITALAARLGKRLERTRAKIILLEGGEPGKAEDKDYVWKGPREEDDGEAS